MRVLAYQGEEGLVLTTTGGFQKKNLAYSVVVSNSPPTRSLVIEDVFIQDDPFRWVPDGCPGEHNVFHVKFPHDVVIPPDNIAPVKTQYDTVAFFGQINGIIPIVDPENELLLYEPALQYSKHGLYDRILFTKHGSRVIISTLAIVKKTGYSGRYYISCYTEIYDPCIGGCYTNSFSSASSAYSTEALNESIAQSEWATHLAVVYEVPVGTSKVEGSQHFYSNAGLSVFYRFQNIDFLKSLFGQDYTSELAEIAYKSCNFFDGNGIAFAIDLLNTRSTVNGFLNAIKGVPSHKVKAVASAYLAAHYGFRLMAADILSLRDEIQRLRKTNVYNARSSYEEVYNGLFITHRFQMKYDPFNEIDSLLDQITRFLDLDLDLGNIWDLVPFSFVVDWFINIGSFFESLDNWANVQRTVTHKATITSRTCEGSYIVDVNNTKIAVPIKGYYRRVFSSLRTPSFSLTRNPLTETCQSHWVEGTALLISKK